MPVSKAAIFPPIDADESMKYTIRQHGTGAVRLNYSYKAF
jgi:hypothetical protein